VEEHLAINRRFVAVFRHFEGLANKNEPADRQMRFVY
jgi:hypothetical protein